MEALLGDTATESRRVEALDELLEFVDDIDIARDFLTIGGLRPLLQGLFACPHASPSHLSQH
jgi:hypothetical protein